jgi:hypothetical protein
MKIKIQVVIENDDPARQPIIEEIVSLERNVENLSSETLGIKLSEAKVILASVQTTLITHQASQFMEQHRCCSHCGASSLKNGTHHLTIRTLFGTVKLASQRFYTCSCQERKNQQQKKRASFSPLAKRLPERTAPEFQYLQTKWAALMSYGLTSQFLSEVLPLEKTISTATLSRQVYRVAIRADSELGDEQYSFVDGCPAQWEQLPLPEAPLVMGIDGGYIHAREGENRKAGFFEVIVGKSMTEDKPSKRFGFVNGHDTKPKRRVYEVLKSQGMQMNQQVIFLSDGGDDVRDLQRYLSPEAEYVLDWFHITMRLTVLGQYTKGLAAQAESKSKGKRKRKEEEDMSPSPDELEKQLERVKWYLWHGNAFTALQIVTDLEEDLEAVETENPSLQKFLDGIGELKTYLTNNRAFLVNYGDRYRHGETISTAFVESTVNEVISKRFVKKQQMRWTKKGAHNLLQARVQVLNDELQQTFCRWYPGMLETQASTQKATA